MILLRQSDSDRYPKNMMVVAKAKNINWSVVKTFKYEKVRVMKMM